MAMPVGALIRYCNSLAYVMTTNFHLLGLAHLTILGAVPLLAAILAAVQRQLSPEFRWLRVGLAAILLSDSALYYGYLASHVQLTFPDHLPLELCDATLCLIIIALFTLNPKIFDLAYYCALAGTSMALLTPDLWESFPSLSTVQFFFAHDLVVTAALYLVWSRLARPRPGSVGRAMLALNIFAATDESLSFKRPSAVRTRKAETLDRSPFFLAANLRGEAFLNLTAETRRHVLKSVSSLPADVRQFGA